MGARPGHPNPTASLPPFTLPNPPVLLKDPYALPSLRKTSSLAGGTALSAVVSAAAAAHAPLDLNDSRAGVTPALTAGPIPAGTVPGEVFSDVAPRSHQEPAGDCGASVLQIARRLVIPVVERRLFASHRYGIRFHGGIKN